MAFSKSRSFFSILSESIKLLPINGKVMSFVVLFSMILTSGVCFLFVYSISLLMDKFVTHQQDFMLNPNSFDMSTTNLSSSSSIPGFGPAQLAGPLLRLQEDLGIFGVVEISYLFVFYIVFLISTVSVILVSSFSYKGKDLSLKELISLIRKTWSRALVTTFYVSALGIGFCFAIGVLICPLVIYHNNFTLSIAILVGIMGFVSYLYLSVTWSLAVVIAIVEESFVGLKALGKADGLIEGKRLHGFFINVFGNLVGLIVFRVYKMVLGGKGLGHRPMACGLLLVSFVVLVKIFVGVAYTVLYFECRKHHGDEYGVEYSKVRNVELINDMA